MDRMIGWGGREILSGGSLVILPALMKPPSGRHQRPRGLNSSKRCALPRTLPLRLPLPAPGLLIGQEAQSSRRRLSSTNGLSIHLRSCRRPWASRLPWSLTLAQTLEVLVLGRLRLLVSISPPAGLGFPFWWAPPVLPEFSSLSRAFAQGFWALSPAACSRGVRRPQAPGWADHEVGARPGVPGALSPFTPPAFFLCVSLQTGRRHLGSRRRKKQPFLVLYSQNNAFKTISREHCAISVVALVVCKIIFS